MGYFQIKESYKEGLMETVLIRNVGLTILLYLIGLYALLITLSAFLELVTNFREVFPSNLRNSFDEEVYKPLEEDFDDGFIEDEANYDIRITEMKAKLDEILKPEIITDEYEKSLEY